MQPTGGFGVSPLPPSLNQRFTCGDIVRWDGSQGGGRSDSGPIATDDNAVRRPPGNVLMVQHDVHEGRVSLHDQLSGLVKAFGGLRVTA